MKARELLRRLAALGVAVEAARGKGGHYLLRHGGKKAPLPVHGDKDIGPAFIKMLCKQLGLNHEDL